MFTSFCDTKTFPSLDPRAPEAARLVRGGRQPLKRGFEIRQDGTKTQIATDLDILDLPYEIADLTSPWAQVAAQLIWLGAQEVREFKLRSGLDADAVWAHLRAIAQAVKLPYRRRESAIATLLEEWFEHVVTLDGTRAAR